MGRHDAGVTTGRHAAPTEQLPVVTPDPKRPRVRSDKYDGLVSAGVALLSANLLAVLFCLGVIVMAVMTMGPKEFTALIIVMWVVWCFRRRK